MNILGPLLGFLFVYYLEALFFDQKEQAAFFISFFLVIIATVFYFFNVPYYDLLLICTFLQACIGFSWTIIQLPQFLFFPKKIFTRLAIYIPRIEFQDSTPKPAYVPVGTPVQPITQEVKQKTTEPSPVLRKSITQIFQEKITISFEISFDYSKKTLRELSSIVSVLAKVILFPTRIVGAIFTKVIRILYTVMILIIKIPLTMTKRITVIMQVLFRRVLNIVQTAGNELTKQRTAQISITTPAISQPALPVIPHTGVSAWPLQLMRGSYTAYKSVNSTIEQLSYFQSLVPVKIVEREKVAPYEHVIYYKPEKKDEAAYIAAFLAIPFKLKENENMGDDLSIILW